MASGLIPARAGNTGEEAPLLPAERAHPRSRGEHPDPHLKELLRQGSSPLARGTLKELSLIVGTSGLIPARAGNTFCCAARYRESRAHPRSRGEHQEQLAGAITRAGSSPLARGTQSPAAEYHTPPGLIPARAGNTAQSLPVPAGGRAHPRSRGEHEKPGGTLSLEWGSSPLARGTQGMDGSARRRPGLIPARAGNTIAWMSSRVRPRAHPRSRGEHSLRGSRAEGTTGSSPLARGTPKEAAIKAAKRGLIPARAGNTGLRRWRGGTSWAHPRSRGEHKAGDCGKGW